ncbi:M20/M25/M40 family metallo-hydrolase [Plantactinospora sp. ZYX-F-223]|uniref:M20/M25/M40 family metallo-hydrolase n=1 Tax=Plantactinospora sp. ZYX-F-223 TaxID=3144103 RepID=UPI0031FDE6B8
MTSPVDLLTDLVAIPSPSYAEHEVAACLVGHMHRLGFAAHLDAAGNAVGVLDRGPGPSVLLLGHIDTVPGGPSLRVTADAVHGRGAVDAKGPMAALTCGAARATGFRGRLTVVGAVEEETPGSRGAMAVRDTLPRPDAVIVGEPSGWSDVVLGYKGKLDLRVRADCPGAHPSAPYPRAVELTARAWAVLLDEIGADPADPASAHRNFADPAATLTLLRGDPEHAEAEMSVRTPPGFDVYACVAAVRARVPAVTVTVLNTVRACRVRRTDPVVRALSGAIRAEGGEPGAKVKTATSDMNTLREVWSVPMATYGPGDSRLDHSDDEHIRIDDFLRGVAVVERALTSLSF